MTERCDDGMPTLDVILRERNPSLRLLEQEGQAIAENVRQAEARSRKKAQT